MERHWVLQDHPQQMIQDLSAQLNVSEVVTRILLNRGIRTFEEARRFLRPSLDDLYDPFAMADMDRAAERLGRAIRDGDPIMIHGDYDVDGVTSVALLKRVLGSLGANLSFYIPDRFREGYGLSKAGIEMAARREVKLLISVDCGIAAVEEVELANELGMEVIVTDHHEPGARIPDAFAVLNPKRKDCSYPFKELSGVGLAFKLLQATFLSEGLDLELVYDNIDLVALGCAADIVPLVHENRTLVKYGLRRIANTENAGLRALIETAELRGKTLGTGQIVFVIAPRINAAGRMDHARKAVDMLTTEEEEEAYRIAEELELENRSRREIDTRMFEEAVDMANRVEDIDERLSLVLASEGWHQGVIGIVASRVVERCRVPTVLISLEGDIGKGSARSIPGFDLYAALSECRSLLTTFGGHRYAAGLTIQRDRIDEFREAFCEVTRSRLRPEDRTPDLKIDGELRLNEIDDRLVRLLNYFAPFGPGNMRPVMVSEGVEVVGSPAIVGTNHLRFKARQNGAIFDCIGFDMGDLLYRLNPGVPDLDLAYVIEENEWRGRKRIQLRIKDLR